MNILAENTRNRAGAAPSKEGAALVIVLGFLAILTITIIAFTTQTRTERIATRSYVTSAKTGYLLDTALTKAMLEIDHEAGADFFPAFFSLVSDTPDENGRLSDSLAFNTESDFIQQGNVLIDRAFSDAVNSAEWLPVLNDNQSVAIGRIGYIVLNTSGLLDANAVGGVDVEGNVVQRRAGTYPSEIQLSNHPLIIDEFHADKKRSFPHIDPDHPSGMPRKAESPDLSVGQAFAYNREQAWKQFETVRDLKQLNQFGTPNLITTDIKSFSTYSFDPREDRRIFMGTNAATLNAEAVSNQVPRAADAGFVLNQLRDYLDTDALPEDENGHYTDLSVEPVPMINEITLDISSLFIPIIENDSEGNTELQSVSVSNTINFSIEVWYPFKDTSNPDTFEIGFTGIDMESGQLLPLNEHPILGNLLDWNDSIELEGRTARAGAPPQTYQIFSTNSLLSAGSQDEIYGLFESLATNIVFTEIYCSNLTRGAKVDSVRNFKLELEDITLDMVLPDMKEIDESFFGSSNGFESDIVSNRLIVGRAVFDPRLNWDGSNTGQWVNVDENGYYLYMPSPDDENEPLFKKLNTPDTIGTIYVRNEDQMDTPWEFTHLLYSTEKPWMTFQMLEEFDPDNSRTILNQLSPYDTDRPRHGRINPYTVHTNVLAAAFMNLPIYDYNSPEITRLKATDATKAAVLFMKEVRKNGWPDSPADYSKAINTTNLAEIIKSSSPLALESFFMGTAELFNPRDTLYTVLLAAQTGIDENENGRIEDHEVQGTRQAVVYIWRDPLTGKSAPIFFGLTDTLQKNDDGNLSELLHPFKP